MSLITFIMYYCIYITVYIFLVGQLLLGFDEENIDQTFNITDPLHKKALLNSIHILKEKGVKPPSNLWEFKVGKQASTRILDPCPISLVIK